MSDAGFVLPAASSRVLNGVISQHEKPILEWLVSRVPQNVNPDHLTIAGVIGAAIVALGLSASHISPAFLALALAGLVLNWIGDSLDGTLARYRAVERPRYGFFVDHLSDVASQSLIVLGLGLSPFMRLDVVSLALVAYLVLSIYTFVKLHVSRTMQLTYFGVGPTEVRALIAFGILVAAATEIPTIDTALGSMSLFDCAALTLVVFAIGSCIAMFRKDLKLLSTIDPPRSATPAEASMVDLTAR